jgi:DNA polymerase III epsilon subunit-like protein
MYLAKYTMPFQKYHKLSDIVDKIKSKQSHRALGDCLMLASVFKSLILNTERMLTASYPDTMSKSMTHHSKFKTICRLLSMLPLV